MDLEQLRIFAALAETGSFSAAGKRLYKSHSSVSRTVSALEREPFALTGEGRRLYDGAKALLEQAEELEKSVKEAGE